jgi:hypothetical protein
VNNGNTMMNYLGMNERILQTTDWAIIAEQVTKHTLPIFNIPFNTRLKSEIISSLFEIEAAKYFQSQGYNVKNATTDREPDLFFEDTQLPLEIKVTRRKKYLKWMGNKVSKQCAQYVLVSWEQDDSNSISYYITSTFLNRKDWSDDEYSYNASFLSWKSLENRKDIVGTIDNPIIVRNKL